VGVHTVKAMLTYCHLLVTSDIGFLGQPCRCPPRLQLTRCLLLALSGLAEMVCKLSALRGEADMRDRVTSTSSVAIDPNVWSGRALQEDFADVADVRSCINVSGL
jgi:hypothetical protein